MAAHADFASLSGTALGERTASYAPEDAILYALAVGAHATDLDLVFEKRLKVLPTFALTLGLWVADAVGELGAFVPAEALHGSQRLLVHRPLPPQGEIGVEGSVVGVWDKGRSTVIDVAAKSEYFTATYSIVLVGKGGWGGDRGPASDRAKIDMTHLVRVTTSPTQAALYRLTGDRHLIHIDPEAARTAGFERPIMHGLCTLGIVARELADASGVHPADLVSLEARFLAPLFPGESLELMSRSARVADPLQFRADAGGRTVIAGSAHFSACSHSKI